MTLRSLCLSLSLVLCAGLFAPPATAQVLYGSIVGAVEDQSGLVVPNATITLTSNATGVSRETTSDEQGRFSLLNLLTGIYQLKAVAAGCRPVAHTDVEVAINTVTRQAFRLEVGAVTEQVTVAGTAAALQ